MDSALKIAQPPLNVKGTLFPEADHYAVPGLTITTSLYEIFEEWNKIQDIYFSNNQKDLTVFNTLNTKIEKHYGSGLVFSLGVLNGKGWFFYNEAEYAKAIEAWEILLTTYPNYSEAYLYIIDAQIQLKMDISKTVEQFNQSLSKSSIFSQKEKEGLLKDLEDLKKSQL